MRALASAPVSMARIVVSSAPVMVAERLPSSMAASGLSVVAAGKASSVASSDCSINARPTRCSHASRAATISEVISAMKGASARARSPNGQFASEPFMQKSWSSQA